jgi:glycosyltransferase involved in cell wall biosynthesis
MLKGLPFALQRLAPPARVLPSPRVRILLDYRPALRNRTGVGEYTHNMAAALARLGGSIDRVTLFSSSWKDRLPAAAVPGAAPVDRRIPVSILNFAWHRLGWPPVEWLGGPTDVAWSLHPLLMPSSRGAQVVTIHDLYFLDHPERTSAEIRRDYAALVKRHAGRADAVIVVSEYTKQQVIDRLGVPPAKIALCPPGAPQWRPRQEPAGGGPILHVGTIEPRKNVPALIAAYLHLVSEPGTPPLVLAGHVERLEAPELEREPARSRVRLLGYVSDDERLRLFQEASMLVLASDDEGFGMPALEAMTMGVPVLASNRGALPEIVGDAGLLVDAGDPAAFADAMRRLLRDAALRRELARRGLARAAAFSWDASAAAARAAFELAADRRRQRR